MSQLEQQMRHRDREMVPRVLVVAMFALMAATLAIVTFARVTDAPKVGVLDPAPVVAMREISLIGGRDGVYRVIDDTGAEIARSSDDLMGFVGVMGRVIERERLVHDYAGGAPIQLIRRANGNIALFDPATDLDVELIGYGADNVAAFGNLID